MHYNNELLTIDRQLIHSNVSLWYQALQTGIYYLYSLRKHKNIFEILLILFDQDDW